MHRLAALFAFLLFAVAQPSAAASLHFALGKSGGDGLVAASDLGYDPTFALFGNGKQTGRATSTTFTAYAPHAFEVSGLWSYASSDWRGPAKDPFGYIINGVKTQLTSSKGAVLQGGRFSFLVGAGDAFGWYVDSKDGYGGRGLALVTGTIAPVPLPAAGLMLLGGLAGLGAAARRRVRA